MAIQSNFPALRPSLDLNFAGSRTVDPRITFSRAGTGSIASYFDEKGVMRFAPPNTPRIDFDPVTLECKGLLIEEQRTNLLKYSEQFDNAVWTKNGATIVTNAAIAPDGTMSADKLVDTPSTFAHRVGSSPTISDNTIYCASVFVKKAELENAAVCIVTKAAGVRAIGINLSTGATFVPSDISGIPTYYGVTDVGGGWYRVYVAHDVNTGSTIENIRIFTLNSTLSINYTGDGVSGIYIWGAQLEQGSFPTSYIPTTSAQVTRAADIFGPASLGVIGAGSAVIDAQARSGQTLMSSGATVVLAPDSSRHRIAVGYDSTSTSSSTDGASIVSASGSTGGTDFSLMPNATGYVKRMAIYPRKLSDTNLQAMTA